jgi:outer membrane receptor protein involved in Fe transport
MIRNLLLTLGIILFTGFYMYAQQGSLQGKVIDKDTKEPIPFANIIVENKGSQVAGSSSDFDGKYSIKPLPPGKMDVKATFVGYKTKLIQGVTIGADRIRFLDIELEATTETLETVEIVDYKVPLIDKDQTASGATITAEEIAKMPQRDANAVATTVGGVFSEDGERGSVRGARGDATATFIDGVRVIGVTTVPQSAIEQVDIILGGVPARYGDVTSGIINITTKGPARQFGFGVELETSKFLDNFDHNRFGFNIMGPLIRGKNKNNTSFLGFFIAGDININGDGRPSAIGYQTTTEDALKFIEQNPLRPTGLGTGTYYNSSFLRSDDLRHVKTSMNTSTQSYNFIGNINIRTTETINLTIGGSYFYSDVHSFLGNGVGYGASLANYDKNPRRKTTNYRVYGKFSQRFPGLSENQGAVRNFFYSIQFDYSKIKGSLGDPDHLDNLFNYGYIGQFTTYKTPTYERGSEMIDGVLYEDVWLLNSWDFDTLVAWDPKNVNPLVAQYTSSYYDIYEGQSEGHFQNLDQIQLGGGLLNGGTPENIYSIYQSPGRNQTGYSEFDNDQYNIRLDASLDIKNNAVKLGFQYEQRVSSSINYFRATDMWTQMRGLANFHIRELDINNPVAIEYDGYVDTIIYYRNYDAPSQRNFDKNLREKLGLPVDGLDFIMTDSYNSETNTMQYYDKYGEMHSATLNGGWDIGMFSADELWNQGFSYYTYSGYNYTGGKSKSQASFDDFFTEQDADGNFTRPIGAYRPIYMAGYIQDQFAFKDLVFNIGVRVDRFDANQKVLKDQYSLYPTESVGEVNELQGQPISHPSNIGSDYVVYVDQVVNPSYVTGYRDGFIWYNADGEEIFDPNVLDVGSGISPKLVHPEQERVTIESFKDYEPQINVMPRISFSFPISDEALFFAHYDVLTQRPQGRIYTNPATWYWFENMTAGAINNPSLKPNKTIDYELGFTQKVSNTSSITITTFYREMREMTQQFRFNGAYPRDYTSYNNIDFSTVKGLTLEFDLRRTRNARIRASYTLQFADGTGSSATTAASLIAAGLPNLRSTYPMPWDRRHAFNILLDYRWGSRKNYNGPRTNRKDGKRPIDWLSNTGFSMTIIGGSGVPYTASRNVNSPISPGANLLKGTFNGSRLPWQFRVDLRVDKDIYFKLNKSKGDNAKTAYLNVYFQFLNLMGTRNVVGVYPFTGNPDDDGYLSAPEWQRQINSQIDPQSFRDLYSEYVNSPFNYSNPRQIRFGLIFNY